MIEDGRQHASRVRRSVVSAVAAATFATTMAAVPAGAFDGPVNLAPGDARIVSDDGFGRLGANVAFADVDFDGLDDLLVVNDNFGGGDGTNIHAYLGVLGQPFGSFGFRDNGTVSGLPDADITITGISPGAGLSLGVADFNGNGTPDIAFTNGSSVTIVETPAPGVHELFDLSSIDLAHTGTADATDVAVGDYDGDGIPDLAIGWADDDVVTIHPGASAGPIVTIVGDAATGFGTSVAAGNVIDTPFGVDDLVIGAPLTDNGAFTDDGTVWAFSDVLSAGSTVFLVEAAAEITGDDDGALLGTAVLVGDVNGAGAPDLLAGAPGGLGGAGFVVRAPGPLSFGTTGSASTFDPWVAAGTGGLGRSLAVGDVDFDDNPDLAAGASDSAAVITFTGEEFLFTASAGADFGNAVAIARQDSLAVGSQTADSFSTVGLQAGAVEIFEVLDPGGPNEFVVDTTTLGDDQAVGDGQCFSENGDCSLRAAIQEANASGGAAITFAIPGAGPHVINSFGLPAITSPVTIDGSTQPGNGDAQTPGAMNLGLRYSGASPDVDGLVFAAGSDGSSVRGLAISGFTGSAIRVDADDVTVRSMRLGIRASEAGSVANQAGISVDGANVVIEDNVISNNQNVGVDLLGANPTLRNNHIGTSVNGEAARPNGLGVNVAVPGGLADIDGNVISGNDGIGIQIKVGTVAIRSNRIGVSPSGAALGNAGQGILAAPTVPDLVEGSIGGNPVDSGNIISNNGAEGVGLIGGVTLAVVGNRYVDNAGLGIDLGSDGPTANDAGDADTGPNDLLNAPIIESATPVGADLEVTIRETTEIGVDQRIQIYGATSCDPTGFGEGQDLLTSFDFAFDPGAATTVTVSPGAFTVLTATTTSLDGSVPVVTSEFSACLDLSAPTDAIVSNLTLDVDLDSTGPGVTAVPVADIPVDAVLDASAAATEAAAPLSAIPLSAIDLQASPLSAIPLSAIPLSAIPLSAIPLSAIPLSAIPLSAIYVDDTGNSWDDLLVGTDLEGRPANSVTLPEALAAAPVGHPLHELGVGDVDLAATPLSAISTTALLLGDLDLRAELDEICADAAAQGVPCTEDRNTLIALEADGYDISASPLSAIPLSAIPLSAIPLSAIPLSAIPLSAIPLSAIPLSAIDIEASPLSAIPLSAIEVGSIPLSAIPLSAIPLSAIPLSAIPLSAIPLSAIELENTDLGDTPLRDLDIDGRDGCAHLAAEETLDADVLTCAELGITGDATIEQLAVALEGQSSSLEASPLSAIPLSAIPLSAIPLSAIDLSDIPLSAIPLSAIPLSAIPLSAIDLQGTPLSAIPLSAIQLDTGDGCAFLVAESSPITCADLPDGATIYDLAVAFEAIDSSLAASPLSAIPLSAIPLSAIELDEGALAGRDASELFDGAESLADLPPEVLAQLDLAELLFILAGPSDYPWEDLDLVALGVQDFVDDAVEIRYTATFDVDAAGVVRVTIELPLGYRYRRTSATFGDPFGAPAAADPAISETADGQILTWLIDTGVGSGRALGFDVSPGFALTTSGTDASVSAANTEVVSDAAPHTVVPVDGPTVVGADVLQLGYVTAPTESDVYTVTSSDAGNQISVFLGHQSTDVDLVLYTPLEALPEGSSEEGAPLGAPIVTDDLLGDVLSEGTDTETLGDVPLDAGASVVESSSDRGVGTETAAATDLDGGTSYQIQVSGYDGAVSDEPYLLRVAERPEIAIPVCDPIAGRPATSDLASSGPLPAGLETIVVFDLGRATALHGPGGAATMDGAAQALVAELNALPAYGSAALLYTDPFTDYSAWDANPCDWEAADAVAKSIRAELTAYAEANESLSYLTIIGGDELIPMHRQQDATAYANEAAFAAEYSETTNPSLFGAFSTRHILTDHPYGDPDPVRWLDRFLYVPEIAIGRLVESPAEVAQAVQTFTDFDGALDTSTGAYVTGYDFLTDGATATADVLGGPAGFGLTTDISETWTDDDVEAELAAIDRASVLSINAHFDPYRALPAAEQKAGEDTYTDATLFQTSDLATVDLERAWLFTMGCHAGVSEADITLGRSDWAQNFVGGGGALMANTGFGYGDTATVALSEALVLGVAENLRPSYWTGPRTIGHAFVDSFNDYFASVGLYGVYDEKVLQEFTLYGLPMYRFDSGVTTQGTPAAPSLTLGTDPFTGGPATLTTIDETFEENDSDKGTFYSADGQTLEVHYRPIQPMTTYDVTVDGLVARGALILDWTSTDIALADVAFARPVIDDGDREGEIEDPDALFPSTFAAIASYERTSPGEGQRTESRQNLNLVLGQYDGASDTQRLFSDVDVEVLYVPEGAVVDNVPATISTVQSAIVDDQVTFIVDVDDATPAARVVVLYRAIGGNDWDAVDLQANSPWSGSATVPSGTEEVEYLVQVVRDNGLVTTSSSKGEFHRAQPLPTEAPPTAELTVDIDGTTAGRWYTGAVVVDADGEAGPFTATVDGRPAELPVTITDSGAHIVTITGADGTNTTVVVPIDNAAPEAALSVPTTVDQGDEVVIAADCRDSGSGLASCVVSVDGVVVAPGSLLDTSEPGTVTLRVTATDLVGNVTVTAQDVTIVGVVEASLEAELDTDRTTTDDPVTVAAVLTDGVATAWTVDWGDGTVDDVVVGSDGATGDALVAGHVYDDSGTYAVTVTAAVAGAEPVVADAGSVFVIDTDAHRLHAAGSFWSPAGSVADAPGASGRATFSLNLRYRDADTPTGAFSMRFRRGGIRFTATEWDYLLTDAGTRWEGGTAIAEGTGRIRHRDGDVHVRIEATDTGIGQWGHGDEIRVILTDADTGDLIYESGAADVWGTVALTPSRGWGHGHGWGHGWDRRGYGYR